MLWRILLASLLCTMAFGPGPALAAGTYFVQLASLNSDASAHQEWARLRKAQPDLFGDLALDVQRADMGAGGIFYRVRIGPFPNKATAQDMCWQIKAAKLACLVVRTK